MNSGWMVGSRGTLAPRETALRRGNPRLRRRNDRGGRRLQVLSVHPEPVLDVTKVGGKVRPCSQVAQILIDKRNRIDPCDCTRLTDHTQRGLTRGDEILLGVPWPSPLCGCGVEQRRRGLGRKVWFAREKRTVGPQTFPGRAGTEGKKGGPVDDLAAFQDHVARQ